MGIECDRCCSDVRSGDYRDMDNNDIWCDDCFAEVNDWRLFFISFGCDHLKEDRFCECTQVKCADCGGTIPRCLLIERISGHKCPACTHSWELKETNSVCPDDECPLCLLEEHCSAIDGYMYDGFGHPHPIKEANKKAVAT